LRKTGPAQSTLEPIERALQKGMSLLADIIGKFEEPFSEVTVTERKLRDNPDEVKRFIGALVENYGVGIAEIARQVGISTSGVSKILTRTLSI
jgi:hypothetical protein